MNNNIKKYFKSILIIFILLILFSIIINSLYYFDIIQNNTTKFIKMFLSIITYFIGGIYIGKNSQNKGYINGLKLSLIIVTILIILGIIFNNININRIIYYLITIFCITFGAMIGINKKTM